MKKIRTALVVAAAMASVPALAQQYSPYYSPWYFGAGVGGGHLNKSGTDLTGFDNAQVDDTETTYTVRAGWRFNRSGSKRRETLRRTSSRTTSRRR